MPLPSVTELCPPIPTSPGTVQIRLPGGAIVTVQPPTPNADLTAIMNSALASVQPALAPLQPVFSVIDAALSIFEAVKSVPEAITKLSPKPIITAISDAAEKVGKLLSLVPQLSVPIMIVDLIDVILKVIDSAIAQLEFIVVQQTNATASRNRANDLGLQTLLDIVDCVEAQIAQNQSNLGSMFSTVDDLIGVMNLLLGLIGLEPIPTIGDLGADAAGAIDSLRDAIELLKNIRDLIPV
jgi:hypothetical protein